MVRTQPKQLQGKWLTGGKRLRQVLEQIGLGGREALNLEVGDKS